MIAIGAYYQCILCSLMNPEIKNRIVLIWLGGNALHCLTTGNSICFRMLPEQELYLDAVFLLVQLPCMGVVSAFTTSDRNWNIIFAVRISLRLPCGCDNKRSAGMLRGFYLDIDLSGMLLLLHGFLTVTLRRTA